MPARRGHVASIGRIANGIVGAVLLQQQTRFACFQRAFVDIKIALIALVAGIGEARAIGRPRAELVDGFWLRSDWDKSRAVATEQGELHTLVPARISAYQQDIGSRRVGSAANTVPHKGKLLWPCRSGCRHIYRNAPHFRNTCDIGQEGEALPTGREAGAIGHANVEVAGKVVCLGWHRFFTSSFNTDLIVTYFWFIAIVHWMRGQGSG